MVSKILIADKVAITLLERFQFTDSKFNMRT